jgi:hypothetical protein
MYSWQVESVLNSNTLSKHYNSGPAANFAMMAACFLLFDLLVIHFDCPAQTRFDLSSYHCIILHSFKSSAQ